MRTQLLMILAIMLFPCLANSAIITQWNPDNVATEPGPYTPEQTYSSHIYNDQFLSQSNGAIIWVESDVMTPGMGVVVDDEVDGSNCLMTAGINPDDMTTKQCSDPFQSSKRFKLSSTATGTAVDLVFDVSDALLSVDTYRVLEKFFNSTHFQISNIVIEIGFGLGADFVAAPAGIGLDFSNREGMIWPTETNTGDTNSINLDALFPFGLFGDASTDPNHEIDGYFDATERARFFLTANRGKIISTGISDNYQDVFGGFLAKTQAINGYFWDHDNDNNTDSVLIAHQTEAGWFTLRPDQWWVDFMLPIPETHLLDGTLTDDTLSDWNANPDDYNIDLIEDLANLNLNYHITTSDIDLWPSYNAVSQTAQFTLRLSSYSVIFKNGYE